MTARTEAEIRETIAAKFVDNGTLNIAGQLIDAFSVAAGGLLDLWDVHDLRASEEDALSAAAWEAIRPVRDRAIIGVQEALIIAALSFAAEFPDAPRAVRETVPA